MKNVTIILSLSALIFFGCSKMEEKKSGSETGPQSNQQMPPVNKNNPHSDQQMDNNNMQPQEIDKKSLELSDAANNFEKEYEKNKSEKNKSELIKKHLEAGKSLFPTEGEPHSMNKEVFRKAYKHYKRVLELDPNNKDAALGKKKIEDMYSLIGMPVPE